MPSNISTDSVEQQRSITKKDNVFIIAIFIAAVGLYSSATFATGAPVTIGQWSVTGGIISDTACSGVGVSCDLIFQDDGLRYEFISTPDGDFARMIVTDSGATGNMSNLSFATESFTPFLQRSDGGEFELANGDIAQGLASSQVIRDSELDFVADIQRGFARDIRTTPLTNEQQASDAWTTKILQVNTGTDVTSGFSVLSYNDVNTFPASTPESDIVRGKAVDVWQTVTDAGTGEKQEFDSRSRSGFKGWTFFGSTPSLTKGGSATLDGTTVSWVAGESVDAVWFGSDIAGLFGFESVTSPSGSATESSVDTVGPFDWQALSSDDMNWPINPWLAPDDPSRALPPSF